MFEIKKSDLAGRIGILYTNHAKIETPAYVPVVHPVRQSIHPKKLKEIGFDLVITNAYITLKQIGEEAVRKGIHKILDYNGAVMTDSGGYQVLEYGDIGIDHKTIASFEKGIGSDIAIPLDKPTGFGLPKKKAKPVSIPLHLFGAGHPLTSPLAVALGCDTFDSASYMLYAKHDRYIMEDGTSHLNEISYFYCNCEVCSSFKPKEIQSLSKEDRINKIALHNLYSIKAEVDRVKESIHEGRLWEYVIRKSRSHPKLFEAISTFTENASFFIETT